MRRFVSTLCVLLLGLALPGCGDSKPAAAPAPPAKKAESPAVSRAPGAGTPVAAPYVYSYNPLGKRDPFRTQVDEVHTPTAESAMCKEPLCQWDLDQLTLVGVVTGDANPLAMVEDPQGRGHIIRRTSRIGKQGGKVTQILRDSVTVTEQWATPDGRVTPNLVTIRLRPDKAFAPIVDLSTGKQY